MKPSVSITLSMVPFPDGRIGVICPVCGAASTATDKGCEHAQGPDPFASHRYIFHHSVSSEE